MCARQREIRRVVIEKCRLPQIGIVAGFAFETEVVFNVIRIGGVLKICLVTGIASRWRSGVTFAVAIDAVHRNMRTRQREICRVVIKRRRFPREICVAIRAHNTEVICHMIRFVSVFKIYLMAGVTVGLQRDEFAIFVAIRALDCRMRPGKREIRQIVIKCGGLPGNFHMAILAFHRKIIGNVIWFQRFLKFRFVAAETVARQSCQLVIGVAIDTLGNRMCAVQLKSAGLNVIERGTLPTVFRVANCAFSRETHRRVVRHFYAAERF